MTHAPVTPSVTHEHSPRNAHAARSRDSALRCFTCARELEAGEPVVVQPLRAGPSSVSIRRLCVRCSELLAPGPGSPLEGRCAECRRPMLLVRLAQTRRPAACGPACFKARRQRFGRDRYASRRAARGDCRTVRTCPICGGSFAGRADRVTCGGRCRQAAHRERARIHPEEQP